MFGSTPSLNVQTIVNTQSHRLPAAAATSTFALRVTAAEAAAFAGTRADRARGAGSYRITPSTL